MICSNYLGEACVSDACPQFLARTYPDFGYEYCSCDECDCYRGCEDCLLIDTKDCIDKRNTHKRK